MVKADIVNCIAERTGCCKEAVIVVVEELMSTIKNSVITGENVYLRGFGTFDTILRREKKYRSKTGVFYILPEHFEPRFKACKEFKELVKEAEQ